LIVGNFYNWSEKNVNAVKEEPAKYELYDGTRTLIYIGSTGNLSERFKGYWSTNFMDNKCKQGTRSYKRLYLGSEQRASELEEENLTEYRIRSGRLPACNQKAI